MRPVAWTTEALIEAYAEAPSLRDTMTAEIVRQRLSRARAWKQGDSGFTDFYPRIQNPRDELQDVELDIRSGRFCDFCRRPNVIFLVLP